MNQLPSSNPKSPLQSVSQSALTPPPPTPPTLPPAPHQSSLRERFRAWWQSIDWRKIFGGMRRAFTLTLIAAISALVVLSLFAVLAYGYIAQTLPSPEQLATYKQAQSTKIFDRNGELLFEMFDANAGRRTVVPVSQMPLVLKQATIATEDPSFYNNPGVDARGIARAVYYLVTTGKPSGGGRQYDYAATCTQHIDHGGTHAGSKNSRSDSCD